MAEHHGHDHGHHAHGHAHHGHAHATPGGRVFAVGVALNLGFVVVETVYGFATGSLSLLADAGHNFGDVLSLLAAWVAAWLAGRRPTARRTYGLRRGTILAALGNAATLIAACGWILWEAVRRLVEPVPVEAGTVAWVAAVGVAVNGLTAMTLLRGAGHDLNIRGAFLHMATDAAMSLGVVAAALAVGATGWLWLDPAASLVISAVILAGTWGFLRESVDLALDAVPAGVEPAEVRRFLAGLPGVVEVHDLHIWGMSTTEVALTAHLVRPEGGADDAFLAHAAHELDHRFRIGHATLQVETGMAGACGLAAHAPTA